MIEYIIKSLLTKIGYDSVKKLISTEDAPLNDKMRNAINNAIEKFRIKYENQYGAVSDNFLASQSNFDKFIESIDFD